MRRSTAVAAAGLAIVAAGALGLTLNNNRAAEARIETCVQRAPEELRGLEPTRQQCQALENAGALERAEKG